MPSRNGLTPDDRKCFDLLQGLVDEDMCQAIFDAMEGAVQRLVTEGKDPRLADEIHDRRVELELVTDDLIRLPDGGFVQLYYELRPITEDQVQEFTGMTLEQWRKEHDPQRGVG